MTVPVRVNPDALFNGTLIVATLLPRSLLGITEMNGVLLLVVQTSGLQPAGEAVTVTVAVPPAPGIGPTTVGETLNAHDGTLGAGAGESDTGAG